MIVFISISIFLSLAVTDFNLIPISLSSFKVTLIFTSLSVSSCSLTIITGTLYHPWGIAMATTKVLEDEEYDSDDEDE